MQGNNTLLDAGAAAIIDTDQRYAERCGEVDNFMDFFSRNLTEGTPVDGEVLGEEAHPFPIDRTETAHDPVRVRAVVIGRPLCPAACQHVQLLERAGVKEVADAFPGSHLAARVLPLYGGVAACMQSGLSTAFELLQAFFHRPLSHPEQPSAPRRATWQAWEQASRVRTGE